MHMTIGAHLITDPVCMPTEMFPRRQMQLEREDEHSRKFSAEQWVELYLQVAMLSTG
jgi:hypothetical protein